MGRHSSTLGTLSSPFLMTRSVRYRFIPRYDRPVILISSSRETGMSLFSTVEQSAVCKAKPRRLLDPKRAESGTTSAPQLPRDHALSTTRHLKIARLQSQGLFRKEPRVLRQLSLRLHAVMTQV